MINIKEQLAALRKEFNVNHATFKQFVKHHEKIHIAKQITLRAQIDQLKKQLPATGKKVLRKDSFYKIREFNVGDKYLSGGIGGLVISRNGNKLVTRDENNREETYNIDESSWRWFKYDGVDKDFKRDFKRAQEAAQGTEG